MSRYIRYYAKGGYYFFTVVTHNRRPILCDEPIRNALRQSIREVQAKQPFEIIAIVLLPDHLHCIWKMPDNDDDYSKRWGNIKRLTSQKCPEYHLNFDEMSLSKNLRREKGIWQRRFYEHLIRDEEDFLQCLNYIHQNPVKHGLVNDAMDWQYSTIHKFSY